jgi:hypothetical protein
VNRAALEWGAFAKGHCVEVRCENRSVHRTTQSIATHLVVTDLDQAATLAGAPWPTLLDNRRRRRQRLTELFGSVPASLLRAVCGRAAMSDVDFDMLCTAALWLRENDPTGLTARQVPI